MARVTAPLLSLDASGTIAKAITYSKWKGRPYARVRVVPSNPRSGLQVGMRSGITFAPNFWNNGLSAAQRLAFGAAVGSEAISGYNLFCRLGQKSLRNDFGYFGTYADMLQEDTPAAPAGPAALQSGTDCVITWTAEPTANGYLIFHSTDTGFTPGIANLIGMARRAIETWTHRNPGLGDQYYDIRSVGDDGGVGALAGEFTEEIE